jgi:hypothetical protein
LFAPKCGKPLQRLSSARRFVDTVISWNGKRRGRTRVGMSVRSERTERAAVLRGIQSMVQAILICRLVWMSVVSPAECWQSWYADRSECQSSVRHNVGNPDMQTGLNVSYLSSRMLAILICRLVWMWVICLTECWPSWYADWSECQSSV